MTAVGPEISVVIATYNRGPALCDLLRDLSGQQLPPGAFEVVVIDDGSQVPAAQSLADFAAPYPFKLERQVNQGPAAARDRGVRAARGNIIVVLDDDMQVAPDFLGAHWQAHKDGAQVVLGHIAPAPALAAMPLFERFHAHQLDKFVHAVQAGAQQVHGIDLCTGNVSFRRADYLAIGGFDRSLDRSEDRELGVRLEKHGASFVFCAQAKSVHASDHNSLDVWLQRAFSYGIYDHRIARKHPDVQRVDPWRFFFLISALSKPLMAVPVASPRRLGPKLSRAVMQAAVACDRVGLKKLALHGTTLTYGLEYFRGVRQECGSLPAAALGLMHYARRARQQPAAEA